MARQRVHDVARRDRRARFTALLHHLSPELLRESFYALRRMAAPEIDGVTCKQHEVDLDERLKDLHPRIHRGIYGAQPSKRVFIPKTDGKLRPLGIAALEDKVVHQAVVTVLNLVYEVDFLGLSSGFRPQRGAHDALDVLWGGLMRKKVNWVLDADIRGFFDTINHEWLLKFVQHRIADPRILHLIRNWLRAGDSEGGNWSKTDVGTSQGAVVSPLLANVYLHPDKTRLIEFGRFAAEHRKKRGERKPETFAFLGFTHSCGRTRQSSGFIVKRNTVSKRLRAKLQEVKQALYKRRHEPIPVQGTWLRGALQGYLNYHAVPGNTEMIEAFHRETSRNWLAALQRRSQRHRLPRKRFAQIAVRWLPKPRILHPYSNERVDAKHPK